jgi:hypothetical protein
LLIPPFAAVQRFREFGKWWGGKGWGIHRYNLVLLDAAAHGRVFSGMLALPPFQIMQVAAEINWSAFHYWNRDSILHGISVLVSG